MQGKLGDVQVASLLQQLATQGSTGFLIVKQEDGEKLQFEVSGGGLVHIHTDLRAPDMRTNLTTG